MNIIILFFAAIVGYPMFMMAVYLFSKAICNQHKEEFSEISLRRKGAVANSKKKNLVHS